MLLNVSESYYQSQLTAWLLLTRERHANVVLFSTKQQVIKGSRHTPHGQDRDQSGLTEGWGSEGLTSLQTITTRSVS